MINYLFDVDGTITPARKKIEKSFEFFFAEWTMYQQSINNNVFLITGSDKKKTISQVGVPLYRLMNGVYQNSGSQLWVRNSIVYEKNWKTPKGLIEDLKSAAKESEWYGKADNNIEVRIGEISSIPISISFSTVGRDANNDLRKKYFYWDNENQERKTIVEQLSTKYPELSFLVGGEISIDILPKGRDKSQVLNQLIGETVFVGDRCEPFGNDFEIAMMADVCYNVKGWEDTSRILLTLLKKNN